MTRLPSCEFWKSCLVAAVVSFIICIVIPLQTYLTNSDAFTFSSHILLKELLLRFALCLLCSVGTLLIVSKWTLVIHVVALCCAFMAFLESGVLSIGLPVLNGDMSGYHSAERCIIDSSILLFIVILFVAFYHYIGKRLVWISIIMILYSSLSFLDIKQKKIESGFQSETRINALIPRNEVIHSVEYSPRKNTMVFILDSISTDAVRDIFRKDPDLSSIFSGFTHYVNNVGMHWYTSVAVPAIMTGCLYESATELASYGQSRYSTRSFINDFIENDIPAFINIAPGGLGYTNRRKVGDYFSSVYPSRIRMIGTTPWTLDEISLFRMCPYGLKSLYVDFLNARIAKKQIEKINYNYDYCIWSTLSKQPVNPTLSQTLQVHHSRGGHPPIVQDKDGHPIQCQTPGYDEYVGQCHYAFKCLGELIKEYQRKDIYDISTIIITADHALTISKDAAALNGAPQEAFPFLMVKAPYSKTPYKESNQPTSHSRIADLVKQSRRENLSQEQIDQILFCSNRVCRLSNSGKLTDWSIDAKRNVTKTIRNDDEPTSDRLKPLVCDFNYDFFIATAGDHYPDFILRNGSRNSSIGIHILQNPMQVVVKAPKPRTKYNLLLKSSARRHNHVEVVVNSHQTFTTSFASDDWTKQTLRIPNISSDENGLISMEFSCSDWNSSFALRNILISNTLNDTHFMPRKIQNSNSLISNDIRVLPRQDAYNWSVAAQGLERGKSYRFRAGSVQIEAGNAENVEAILYDRKTKRYCKRYKFKVDGNLAQDRFEWSFDVPHEDGMYELLLYAGVAGQCSGIGVIYKDVSLVETTNCTSLINSKKDADVPEIQHGEFSHNIQILPKPNDYNWVVASPRLEPGKTYLFRADSARIESGNTPYVEAILYDRTTKRYCKRRKFEIVDGESRHPLKWSVDVPHDHGEYVLLLYSGVAGQCRNIGVLYKNVSLREELTLSSEDSSTTSAE